MPDYTEELLICCFLDGGEDRLRRFLQMQGETPINPNLIHNAMIFAVRSGNEKCLKMIIKNLYGTQLCQTTRDANGMTVFHIACAMGFVSCMLVLLNNGVDYNLHTLKVGDQYEATPLMICCSRGFVKCLALLLDRGANPTLVNKEGSTLVHLASTSPSGLKCLQLLISRNFNLNEKRVDGRTPLDIARMYGNKDIETMLLQSNAVGMSLVHIRPLSKELKTSKDDFDAEVLQSFENAKRCDYAPCNASAEDKKMAKLSKCPLCNEGRYCCQDHCNLDWGRHKILCMEIRVPL